jgi:hypothetical protein
MASLAESGSVVCLMAIETYGHRRDAGYLGHRFDFSDVPVAGLTFDSRIKVFAVRPGHAGKYRIYPHPRYWLPRFCKRDKLRDRGLPLCVTDLTVGARRVRHQLARIRIFVAAFTSEAQGQMYLVIVRNRLDGRHMLRYVVGHFLFHGLSCRRLSRVGSQ